MAAVCPAQTILHESAALGQTGQIGQNGLSQVDPDGVFASRFEITTPTETLLVGGHVSAPQGYSLFVAVVRLDGPAALPHGTPFTEDELLAVTTFEPGAPSSDYLVPLGVTLAPGHYAVVIGAGLYGATLDPCCYDFMIANNVPFPSSSFFMWGDAHNGNMMWQDVSSAKWRFVVLGPAAAGDPVPTLSSVALAAVALLLCAAGAMVVQRRRGVQA